MTCNLSIKCCFAGYCTVRRRRMQMMGWMSNEAMQEGACSRGIEVSREQNSNVPRTDSDCSFMTSWTSDRDDAQVSKFASPFLIGEDTYKTVLTIRTWKPYQRVCRMVRVWVGCGVWFSTHVWKQQRVRARSKRSLPKQNAFWLSHKNLAYLITHSSSLE
jgi:hypothetical protein